MPLVSQSNHTISGLLIVCLLYMHTIIADLHTKAYTVMSPAGILRASRPSECAPAP